jgi:hypothetical protein
MKHSESQLVQFKSDLMLFIAYLEKLTDVDKIMWDLTGMELVIDPELQIWIDENINKKEIELGIRKEAFVMPAGFIAQLSVEQTMSEIYGQCINTRYFSSSDEALAWLLNGH